MDTINSSSSRTIEDICSVNGQRCRDVPPLSQSLMPNFNEIRKVYDTFFAPGLDQLIETGSTRWFALKGFLLLSDDRSLLAQFMLYLTLVSIPPNVRTNGILTTDQSALATQEARVTWLLLNLCVRQAQEGDDENADRFARRIKALEALLTCEPSVRTGSMSDFFHQPEPDPEPDQDIDMLVEGIPTVANNPLLEKPFMKQMAGRSDQFWQVVEQAAEDPRAIQPECFEQTRALLDGMESRDIIYSILLLCKPAPSTRPGTAHSSHSAMMNRVTSNQSPNRALKRTEQEQAGRLLENEWTGRATNIVLQNLAGMGLRAFV